MTDTARGPHFAKARDRLSGLQYQIRARYRIGADGSRSMVAENAGGRSRPDRSESVAVSKRRAFNATLRADPRAAKNLRVIFVDAATGKRGRLSLYPGKPRL
jgi:flavin-dependent dehydrogenase